MSKKFISIGWKISAYVVLITSFLTLTILVPYYYISYDLELNRVDRQQEEIEASHIPVLTKSLWNFEFEKIEYQIQGMLAMEHVNYLELNSRGELHKYGTPITDGDVLEKSSPLIRPTGEVLGRLTIQFSKQSITESVLGQFKAIIIPVVLQILFITLSVIAIYHLGINRHLRQFAEYTKNLTTENLDLKFHFKRRNRKSRDELDLLLESVDYMRTNMIQQLRRQQEMERQISRNDKMEALGTLAGGVAHDLNNILTGIVSYPDLLMGEFPEGSRMWRSLEKIKNSGLRASAIVHDLLTLARRAVPTMKVLDLHSVVTDFFNSPEFHQLSLIHPMIEMSWDPQAKHPIILGSQIHITKAIMNLVINGMEAIEGSGAVTVSTSNAEKNHPDGNIDGKHSRYVVLTVQDNGIGMNKQDSERIFEPFYTKKTMGRSGSGLGMTVVYGAVQDHNGGIDIQSVEGEGSRIALYFPLTDLPLETEALPSSADHLGKGESVLVVDDIQEQRDVATAILKQLNYNAMAVSSGKDAVIFLRKYPADIILLDMIMEGSMDGLDTFIEIKRINPDQKVILVSGYSESSRVKEAIRMGARGYIQKPYLINRLGSAIHRQLTLPIS